MMRIRKSHRRTAPRRAGMKLKPAEATLFKYRLMKPHRTISIPTQANNGTTRAGLPRSR
jgi:hypothetical protein